MFHSHFPSDEPGTYRQTTSAVIRPHGTLLKYKPDGEEGLLFADIDLTAATRLLANRCLTDP